MVPSLYDLYLPDLSHFHFNPSLYFNLTTTVGHTRTGFCQADQTCVYLLLCRSLIQTPHYSKTPWLSYVPEQPQLQGYVESDGERLPEFDAD